jgi:GNAT superfamily N-acetyltransferase
LTTHTPSNPRVVVRPVPASQTWDLRLRVLRDNDATKPVRWPRDDDPATIHLAAFVDGGEAPVAIGTLYPAPLEDQSLAEGVAPHLQWQFRGMASDPRVRGIGCAHAVMASIIAHARSRGAALLWCNARLIAIGFYEKFAMRVRGDEFIIPEVGPHKVMTLRDF